MYEKQSQKATVVCNIVRNDRNVRDKVSGVLLNMEVGIRKRVWHTCIRYTLLIYDH